MNFSSDPLKWINEYLDYFIIKLEKSNFNNKSIFIKGLNECRTQKNDNFLKDLRETHYLFYNTYKIDLLDYNNFYRCKELNLPIKI